MTISVMMIETDDRTKGVIYRLLHVCLLCFLPLLCIGYVIPLLLLVAISDRVSDEFMANSRIHFLLLFSVILG